MMNSVPSTGSGSRTRLIGSNSMPTETKNSTAKASRSGSDSSAARWLSSDSLEDHAGEEGAERERHAEELGRAEGDAERDREHGEPEQLARSGVGDRVQDPRDDTPPDEQHEGDEGSDLGDGERENAGQAEAEPGARTDRRCAASPCRQGARRAPAAARGRAPSTSPRRSASRSRCGRARSRAGAGPAARAAGPRCWRPRAPGRRRGPRRAASRATSARPSPAAWRSRSGRSRPGRRSLCTDSRSLSEKCRPTPNISRMTPISASSGASSVSATKPGVQARPARPRADSRPAAAAQPVGQRAEHESERRGRRRSW